MLGISSTMLRAAICLGLLFVALPIAARDDVTPAAEPAADLQYEISPERSWLRVLVYRGGLLGGLGHNHVVSHTRISGSATVGSNPLHASFLIELNVADFAVDDAATRDLEGDDFPGAIPAKDIAGTRKNMLGRKLLDAEHFPIIRLQSANAVGELPDVNLPLVVTLRGSEYALMVPVSVALSDSGFVASGRMAISHPDVGLSPFKAALGALRVRDELIVKFEIVGERQVSNNNINNNRD